MKKRIIIGLAFFTAIFFFGGIYVISTIQKATSTLDNLIKLHQVHMLREQLLLEAKKAQADFAFRHTRHAPELEAVIANVVQMANKGRRCLECHHREEVTARIADVRNEIATYEDALSRLLTMRASPSRMASEEDRAFKVGQELVNQLDSIILLAQTRLEKKTQSSLKEIETMKSLLFILISAGPILALGLAVILIKGLTGPLDVLLEATRKVRGGDLNFRIRGLKDEFGEVADSFNEMAGSLNRQMENLQRVQQIKVVGELAAGLVHEIKNPLTGIKASMQVLLEQGSCGKEDQMVLAAALDEVKRIEVLLRGLLDFAKPPKPQLVQVAMNTVLESSLAFSLPYSSVAPHLPRTIEIVKELDPDLPTALADPGQMQQVFLNLLMNGLEAMPEGGTLTVRTRATAQGIQIEIADTGKGIDEGIREKLFQPFFTTKHKGTGLGLAVTKRFVEMHGGTISTEKNPGGGTVFKILLPPAPEAEEKEGQPASERDQGQKLEK